ncbi:hypothetical protein [Algisphaera agarilytica]|uniref:Uncharacterized protein n=1 Tax=Algisphaera agarilytica TaxID=1385975 RepID=A0A7X0LLR2_9BACT|nr:hypothetical protein [Algisphaera agarilytica]MBB6431282.1 hypothetical protein [Algisphaera agarilytica]
MKRRRGQIASLVLALGLFGSLGVGCTSAPTIRISHAPTYSYLQDPEARAAVELWPALPGEGQSLAAVDQDD